MTEKEFLDGMAFVLLSSGVGLCAASLLLACIAAWVK